MKIIRTDQVGPDDLVAQEKEWIYNGLDCIITNEVLDVLLPQLDNQTTGTYSFSRDLQAPILEMRCRGVLIDQRRRAEVIDLYFDQLDRLEEQLNRIVGHGLGLWQFNWRSNKDLHLLFYDHLGLPPIRRGGRPTVNR